MRAQTLTVLLALAALLCLPALAAAADSMVTRDSFVQGLGGAEPPAQTPGQAPGALKLRGPAGVRKQGDEQPAPKAKEIAVTIRFKSGSTEIADEFSRRQVQEIAQALADPALKQARLEIGGHTDGIGSEAYNMELSQRRAQAIKDALCRAKGVPCANLSAKGYGKGQPVAGNDDEEGRAQNRRVVFKRLPAPGQ